MANNLRISKQDDEQQNQTGNGTSLYQPSDSVKQAQSMLEQQLAQKPGAYQSPWQSQLNDIIDKIQNREKFSYDMNGDALYQQYKNQYKLQGQQAMMDTMGQATALTGGYGNSYAQQAGQQAYHGYLQQLNDRVPELYQLALSRYQMEGNDLLNQYGMMNDREGQDYNRYRDQLGDWQSEADRLQSQYNAERDYDYGRYQDDRNFQYAADRDKVSDQQWQAQFDEAKRQWDAQHSGSSGSGGKDEPGLDDSPDPYEGISDTARAVIDSVAGRLKNVASLGKNFKRADSFIRQVDDTYDREKSNGNETAYKKKILNAVNRRGTAGTLSKDEVIYIMNYYKLWDMVD